AELWLGGILKANFRFGALNQLLLKRRPLARCFPSLAQVRCLESSRRQVFAINDHQLLAFFGIQKMNETHVHHVCGNFVSFLTYQRIDVFTVRSSLSFFSIRTRPGFSIKIQTTYRGVPR